jgi:hypothetical protein
VVAEAKARLAERRQAVVAAAGGGGLSEWNRELMNLSLDAHERRARTKFLEESLKRLHGAMPLLDKLEAVRDAQRMAVRDVDRAQTAMEEAERSLLRLEAKFPPNTPRQ